MCWLVRRSEGRITVKMRWKEYCSTIEDEEAYALVKKNTTGSRPRELFEDLIEDMEAEYDKAKVSLAWW